MKKNYTYAYKNIKKNNESLQKFLDNHLPELPENYSNHSEMKEKLLAYIKILKEEKETLEGNLDLNIRMKEYMVTRNLSDVSMFYEDVFGETTNSLVGDADTFEY
jgi:hypothetical protein